MNAILKTVMTVLKAVAFGTAAAVLVLSIMDVVDLETSVLLLSIGLVAVALVSLQGGNQKT
jgi:hypothetical protein